MNRRSRKRKEKKKEKIGACLLFDLQKRSEGQVRVGQDSRVF